MSSAKNAANHAMFAALQKNDMVSLEQALALGANPNIRAPNGMSPVILALCLPKRQEPVALRLLVERGANLWRVWTDRNDGTTDMEDVLLSATEWSTSQVKSSSLWDTIAQQFVDQGLMAQEKIRSRLLYLVYDHAFSDEEPSFPWRLLAEALDRRLGSDLWNTAIGRSLWAHGLPLVIMAAHERNWPAVKWLLDHGANPGATVPKTKRLDLHGYLGWSGATLKDLVAHTPVPPDLHSESLNSSHEPLRQQILAQLSV